MIDCKRHDALYVCVIADIIFIRLSCSISDYQFSSYAKCLHFLLQYCGISPNVV